jgi:hypothetical protein
MWVYGKKKELYKHKNIKPMSKILQSLIVNDYIFKKIKINNC